ncbi:TetR family transcriptional regulator, partial [Streptomyces sp. SID625]|nr:TetR family transcriptional regulator [Streptomyces sp. SID625]
MTTNAGEPQTRPRRRAPAGAAVLREDVTDAIRAAVFAELASVGYARMSIEGIARRAGVGKTAVYRRWRSKLHLVLDVVSALAVQGLPAPDTGSLETDLRMLYEVT